MKIQAQDEIIKQAFISLNPSGLVKLDETASYSHDYKHELIEKLKKVFSEIKSKGTKSLISKSTECKYCYPSAKAYEFHDAATDEFVIRYIIHKESKSSYIVSQCGNKNHAFIKKGMPF